MTITEAAIKYRQSEERQVEIEHKYLDIDNAEVVLKEKIVELKREIKKATDQKRIVSLQMRIRAAGNEIDNQNSIYRHLKEQFNVEERYQRDLRKVYGRDLLFKEYDRLYHGK